MLSMCATHIIRLWFQDPRFWTEERDRHFEACGAPMDRAGHQRSLPRGRHERAAAGGYHKLARLAGKRFFWGHGPSFVGVPVPCCGFGLFHSPVWGCAAARLSRRVNLVWSSPLLSGAWPHRTGAAKPFRPWPRSCV